MNGWNLPRSVQVDGRDWAVNADFRDVLDVIGWLDGAEGEDLLPEERWYVALALFSREFDAMPEWQQDAPLIAAGVNRAAGCEVRALPFVHWWSFLGWFSAIGEGPLATVVAIRDKLRRGKKLEAWELSYYRAHRDQVDLRPARSAAEQAEHDRLLALLGK